MPDPRLKELSTMNTIGEILNKELEFRGAIQTSLEKLVTLLNLSAGWVFLTRVEQGDSHQGSFRVAASTGLPPALAKHNEAPLCEGGCDCQWLFREGRLDAGVNIVHCSRLEKATADKEGLEIHASVPLLGQAGPVGIINLAAPGKKQFDEETLSFLTAIGRQLGTAFERFRLQEKRSLEAQHVAALEERHRLAADIHDSVTQLLFAADLSLRTALETKAKTQKDTSLAKTTELLESALAELRGLVEVMRPLDLSHGLQAALARLAERTTGVVKVHLETQAVQIPDGIAEVLYRVAQEAVHNALKHGEADNIWMRLVTEANRLKLMIEDDGKGCDQIEEGLGLTSMRERVKAVNGTFSLLSKTDEGMSIEVLV